MWERIILVHPALLNQQATWRPEGWRCIWLSRIGSASLIPAPAQRGQHMPENLVYRLRRSRPSRPARGEDGGRGPDIRKRYFEARLGQRHVRSPAPNDSAAAARSDDAIVASQTALDMRGPRPCRPRRGSRRLPTPRSGGLRPVMKLAGERNHGTVRFRASARPRRAPRPAPCRESGRTPLRG